MPMSDGGGVAGREVVSGTGLGDGVTAIATGSVGEGVCVGCGVGECRGGGVAVGLGGGGYPTVKG